MSKVLSDLSNELSQTVEAAGNSVVRVEGRGRLPSSGIAWSGDGTVVTANHGVERDDNIKVGIPNGDSVDSVPAELVGRDPTTDLAVLKVDGASIATTGLTEPADVRVGNLVLALGRPGKTVQATLGIVSALGKSWRTRAGGQIDRYLQTDVVMYPGFSGGALVDALGNVVGLNTSALTRGVTVSIPVPTVRRVAEAILEHGKVSRGYLGVGSQPARLPDSLDLDQETGLLVVSVESGSASDKGGIVMGDTIISANAEPIRHLDDLLAFLSGDVVGKDVRLNILRGGQLQELTVTVGERS